jgi:hypothetical protein
LVDISAKTTLRLHEVNKMDLKKPRIATRLITTGADYRIRTDDLPLTSNNLWTSPTFVDVFQLPVCNCSNAIGLS